MPGVNLGLPEILIIAVIVILLFGVGRIGKIGGELGKGIKEFRTAIKEEDKPAEDAAAKKDEPKASA
jgi:sec-independent protein translocase protein TatA